MWWVVILFSAALAYWYFTSWAPFRKGYIIANDCAAGIHSSFLFIDSEILNNAHFKISDWIWKDRYLVGYSHGYVAAVVLASKTSFTTAQKGKIVANVYDRLASTSSLDVRKWINDLYSEKDKQFLRGVEQGGNVALLAANCAGPSLLANPDVQRAFGSAPNLVKDIVNMRGFDETIEVSSTIAASANLAKFYLKNYERSLGH